MNVTLCIICLQAILARHRQAGLQTHAMNNLTVLSQMIDVSDEFKGCKTI